MDLRAEVRKSGGSQAWADAVARDWKTAPLSGTDAKLCAYAEKLTLRPSGMTEADVGTLRAAGLDDRAIHDAIQVVGYFNYINRVADAVHVDLEPEMGAYPGSPSVTLGD